MDLLYFAVLMLVLGACSSYLSELALQAQEKRLPQLTLTVAPALKGSHVKEVDLISGSSVVGMNVSLSLLLAIRTLFGGNVAPYERLLSRARRLALLRMKQMSPYADFFVGVRFEMVVLNTTEGRFRNFPKVEVLAYGTAVRTKRGVHSS